MTFLQNSVLKKIVILFFVINCHVYFQGFSVVKNLQAQLWSFAKFQAIHPYKTSENQTIQSKSDKEAKQSFKVKCQSLQHDKLVFENQELNPWHIYHFCVPRVHLHTKYIKEPK